MLNYVYTLVKNYQFWIKPKMKIKVRLYVEAENFFLILAIVDLDIKWVSRTDGTMTNMTTGITRTQFKVNYWEYRHANRFSLR
jgi:hypothetical protein